MLKDLDPLLVPDLLWCLRAMGHGDEITIVDANFPADSVAKQTHFGRPIRLPDVDTHRALKAILSLMPLDTFVDHAVHRMEMVGDPVTIPPVQQECQDLIDAVEASPKPMGSHERHAFYDAAKQTFAIVQTGEPRGYGNLVLKKGVILSD